MLYRVSELDSSSSPDSLVFPSTESQTSYQSLLISVSRRLLGLINDFLGFFPCPPTVSLVFGLYRCHISIGYLAQYILHQPGLQEAREDIALLAKISTGVSYAARGHDDLKPLVSSLQEILCSLQWSHNQSM